MGNVAFLGLGAMGSRMAARHLDSGPQLVVWNRTAAKAKPLADAGARVAATPADAVRNADVVITMLANPGAVREVVAGPSGVAHAMPDGATLIEMSTVGPATVSWLRTMLPTSARLIDAPVLGSLAEAAAGRLTIFAGGDTADVDRWRPLLGRMGTVKAVGESGMGAAAKLVANAALLSTVVSLGETLALGDRLGLARTDVFDVLSATPLAAQAERRRPAIEAGTFPPRFALALARKDAGLVTDAAARTGLRLLVMDAVRDWLEAAEAAGRGGEDYAAVVMQIIRTGQANGSG
jgi:3-hydroxyisobutyrate dehydrogenase-like beta-hydroxyacid dehydrogenase